MGGIPAIPPTPYQNPVLDELDRLSPQAKDALSRAHQSIASIQQPPEMAPVRLPDLPRLRPTPRSRSAEPRPPLPALLRR
jgi:hypothetical protein